MQYYWHQPLSDLETSSIRYIIPSSTDAAGEQESSLTDLNILWQFSNFQQNCIHFRLSQSWDSIRTKWTQQPCRTPTAKFVRFVTKMFCVPDVSCWMVWWRISVWPALDSRQSFRWVNNSFLFSNCVKVKLWKCVQFWILLLFGLPFNSRWNHRDQCLQTVLRSVQRRFSAVSSREKPTQFDEAGIPVHPMREEIQSQG